MIRSYEPILSLLCLILSALVSAQGLTYPETQRVDHWDEYHGVRVHDPYRWLEQDVRESEMVRQWVEAQNGVTFDYLEGLPLRAHFKARLTKLWDYEKYDSVPQARVRKILLLPMTRKRDGVKTEESSLWLFQNR